MPIKARSLTYKSGTELGKEANVLLLIWITNAKQKAERAKAEHEDVGQTRGPNTNYEIVKHEGANTKAPTRRLNTKPEEEDQTPRPNPDVRTPKLEHEGANTKARTRRREHTGANTKVQASNETRTLL